MKKCNKCLKEKDENHFSRRSNGKLRSICKECKNNYRKVRYWKDRKKELEENKKYREKNKVLLNEKRRKRTGAKPRYKGRDPEKYRKVVERRLRVYKNKYPEKIRAQALVRNALRRKEISKPEKCTECGQNKRLEAHHPDYAQPLNVLWLCRQCHVKLHRRQNDEHLESIRHQA